MTWRNIQLSDVSDTSVTEQVIRGWFSHGETDENWAGVQSNVQNGLPEGSMSGRQDNGLELNARLATLVSGFQMMNTSYSSTNWNSAFVAWNMVDNSFTYYAKRNGGLRINRTFLNVNTMEPRVGYSDIVAPIVVQFTANCQINEQMWRRAERIRNTEILNVILVVNATRMTRSCQTTANTALTSAMQQAGVRTSTVTTTLSLGTVDYYHEDYPTSQRNRINSGNMHPHVSIRLSGGSGKTSESMIAYSDHFACLISRSPIENTEEVTEELVSLFEPERPEWVTNIQAELNMDYDEQIGPVATCMNLRATEITLEELSSTVTLRTGDYLNDYIVWHHSFGDLPLLVLPITGEIGFSNGVYSVEPGVYEIVPDAIDASNYALRARLLPFVDTIPVTMERNRIHSVSFSELNTTTSVEPHKNLDSIKQQEINEGGKSSDDSWLGRMKKLD